MKTVVQRVSSGEVNIPSENYSESINEGLVILLGIKDTDTEKDSEYLADKCTNLRIFEDKDGKMNLSVKEIAGEVLIISQFTIYGNASKGNRPSFIEAAKPELAEKLYQKFTARFKQNIGKEKVKTGIFGAMMKVKIVNSGPVTIIVTSKEEN